MVADCMESSSAVHSDSYSTSKNHHHHDMDNNGHANNTSVTSSTSNNGQTRHHHRNYTNHSHLSMASSFSSQSNHKNTNTSQNVEEWRNVINTTNSILNLSDSLENSHDQSHDQSQDLPIMGGDGIVGPDDGSHYSAPDDPDLYMFFDGEVPQTPINRSLLEDSDEEEEAMASHMDEDAADNIILADSDVELSPIMKRNDEDDVYENDFSRDDDKLEKGGDPTEDETTASLSAGSSSSGSQQQHHSEDHRDASIPAPPTPLRQTTMPDFHQEPPRTPDLRHSCIGTGCPTAITTTTTTTRRTPLKKSSRPPPPQEQIHTEEFPSSSTSSPCTITTADNSTKTQPTSNITHNSELSETPTNTSVLDSILDTSKYSLHQVTESFTEAFCPGDDEDFLTSTTLSTTSGTATNNFKSALMEGTATPDGIGGSASCGDVLHQYSNNTIQLSRSIQDQLQSDFESLLGCGVNPNEDELVQVWRKQDGTTNVSSSSPHKIKKPPVPAIFQLPHKRASLQRRATRIHQFRQEQELFGTTQQNKAATTGPQRRKLSKTKTNIPSLPLALGGNSGKGISCPLSPQQQQLQLRPRAKSQDDSTVELAKMTLSPKRSSFTNFFDDLLEVPPVEDIGTFMGTTTTTKKDAEKEDDGISSDGQQGGYDSDPGEISHYVESHKTHDAKRTTKAADITQVTADMTSTSLLDQSDEEYDDSTGTVVTPRRQQQQLSPEQEKALEEQRRKYVNKTPPFGGGDRYIQEALNSTYTLKWHGENTLVPISSSSEKDDSSSEDKGTLYKLEKNLNSSPTAVRMWIERGTLLHFGQTCIEPQIMWRPIFTDSTCTQANIAEVPPESIRLMAICRILECEPEHLELENGRDTMISCSKCFILKNTKGTEYIFEASSVEERNEICQLWKYAVARLASLAMVGEEETMAYEFFTADATLQGGQPIY
mmetsp:Transcript_14476/g.20413  ORF Transcript_14476/g.20413 Transcript_14476/m.20413 type:complete len:940 (-) Transcript_14476:320-3139(-)